MSEIQFTKLQGLGNDFLVIPVEDVQTLRAAREIAIQMCQRNYGAGADGIVFVTRARHSDADFASRIFNADGSEAEVSGNGTRCVAAYLYYAGMWKEPEVRIATAAGVKYGRLVSREGVQFEFEFDMGEPRFSSLDVPMALEEPLPSVVSYPLRLGGDVFDVTCMSVGNPQCVIFVPDLEAINLNEVGPLIEDHPAFPNRTNVAFARVVARDEIEILIWERGAGRTLSSGTGASASAIAGALNGLTGRNVRVRTPGGTLRVDWRADNSIALTGPAEVVYSGRWLRASSS
ncbi:MAG TPA: diaminopimelate epimerase [Blastocatellia bacterium]|nr:diaminopimelate epimerase [Blastocatellia bacterium]